MGENNSKSVVSSPETDIKFDSEKDVKDAVRNWLTAEFGEGFSVESGEIKLDKYGRRADVVVWSTFGGLKSEKIFAVECKKNNDIRKISKSIGQAIMYRVSGLSSGIACPHIPEDVKQELDELPLYVFEVNSPTNVTQVSTPNDRKLKEDIKTIKEKDKRIEKLIRENRLKEQMIHQISERGDFVYEYIDRPSKKE